MKQSRLGRFLLASVVVAMGFVVTPSKADHNPCHDVVWTGIVGVGQTPGGPAVCIGDQHYQIRNFGDGSVAVRQCDDSIGGTGECEPILARTGVTAEPVDLTCVSVKVWVNDPEEPTVGPSNVGVCSP